MPKFNVRLLRDTTRYVDVEVEAEDLVEAEEEAQLLGFQPGLKWRVSDESGAPYVSEDETEEVE